MKTTLRNLSLLAALAIGGSASAQLPDGGVYGDGHIITDINGESHNIDNILFTGKAVIIDAFADWCPPCWTYHESGVLEELHEDLLYVEIFGLEADPGVPEANISDASTGMGDWTLGGSVTYTLADDDEIEDRINLGYYPTLVLVCPDKSTTEIGQASYDTWKSAILNCPGIVTGMDENEAISLTNVYPNPANETANVQFLVKEAAMAKVEVLNALGQVVISQDLGQVSGTQNVALNTANVENGMYIVRLTVGDNIVTKSLAIEK